MLPLGACHTSVLPPGALLRLELEVVKRATTNVQNGLVSSGRFLMGLV